MLLCATATCMPELARAPPAHFTHAIKHLLGRNDSPSLPTGAVFLGLEGTTAHCQSAGPAVGHVSEPPRAEPCGQSLHPAAHRAQTGGREHCGLLQLQTPSIKANGCQGHLWKRYWRPQCSQLAKPQSCIRQKEPNIKTAMAYAFNLCVYFILYVYFQGDYQ